MKVLITTDWYKPIVNGVVTSVLNLENELRSRGHEVKVITLSQDGFEKKDGDVYYLKSFDIGKIYPQARGTFPYAKVYMEELLQWKPDIVHSQCEFMSYPFALRISKKCRTPLVHTYHTVYEDYTHYFTHHDNLGRKAVAIFTRLSLQKPSTIIVPTKKVKKLLSGYGMKNNLKVIPSGINLDKFEMRIAPDKKKRLKNELGIPYDHKVLVTVARLAREKNIQEIIEFLSHADVRKITYLIVGDGPYREELEKKVKESNLQHLIRFTGMVKPDEVQDYYQLGDIFVCGSVSETQGLTYIEALAAGVPIVCRWDECLAEVLVEDFNGYAYESEDEFIGHIKAMCGDEGLYRRIQKNTVKSIEELSSKAFGRNMEELYFSELFKYERRPTFAGIHPFRNKAAM